MEELEQVPVRTHFKLCILNFSWINNLGGFQTARSGLDYQPFSETLVFEVSSNTLPIK